MCQEEAQQPKDTGPKKMSGMSILGNEETPKSLVIVPWKSSEMGDDIGLSDTLDDRAQPVDKEVFCASWSISRSDPANNARSQQVRTVAIV